MINIVYHRSSSLGNFAYCQQQWFINYILGWQAKSGSKADLGSATHAVFEVLAIGKKYIQDYGPDPHTQFVVNQEPVGEFIFTADELYTNRFIDKTLERCLTFYIENNPHNKFDYKVDYKFCRKMIYDTLAFNDGEFDPRNCNIVSPELPFDIPLEFDWAKYTYTDKDGNEITDYLHIKGTMDLIVDVSCDIMGKCIRVQDYKTGKRIDWATGEVKNYDKLAVDIQLLLYNYAISKLFPEFTIITTIIYCREGGPFTLIFDESDRKFFLEKLRNLHEEMVNCKQPRLVSQKRTDFRCTKLCHYYKNNWPGTNKTMCHFIEDEIKNKGIEKVVDLYTKEGFSVSHYVDPGSVDR